VEPLMVDRKLIADPNTHYGNGRQATRSFKWQRITGAINILGLAFLIWLVVSLAGADRAAFVATIANPLVAIATALMIVIALIHMRIGMTEVIEDYVHGPANRLALLLNDIFTLAVAVLALGSLIKLVFWG
jgi:succinate dehydrogenase / fumarate reductase membrane anchor subunit